MKIKILTLAFFSLFVSCNDATDIIQEGELNDERLFTNVQNMQLFLNETYDRVATENDIMASSLLSDEVATGGALVSDDTQRFTVFSTNDYASTIWATHYNLINYCNRIIRGATYFTPTTQSDIDQYNSILAQTRALRAYGHFQLLSYFSTDISNSDALGVMLLNKVPTIEEDIPRSTNGLIFELIDSDLQFAENNLIESTDNTYKHITFNFINAFKARMYLYRKNYSQALFYANKVLDESGLVLSSSEFALPQYYPIDTSYIPSSSGSTTVNVQPGTSVAQRDQRALYQVDQWASVLAPQYRKMWVDGDQGEIIFSVDRQNSRTNFGSRYNTNGSYITGGPLFDMSRNLFNLYTQPLGGGAQDFRRWCFVDRSSTISANPETATRTSEQIVIDKYPGKIGAHTANDLKIFRLSEIYFIKAECLVRNGDLSGASNLIQQVRQARNYIIGAVVPSPIYNNSTEAFFDILLERRKELAFEGHRYIDLKRLGSDAGVSGTDRNQQDAVNSSALNPANISLGDYRFTLPIPQDEINVNPLFQNPGY